MNDSLYKPQLAQKLNEDFQSARFLQLPEQKQANVKANVDYLLSRGMFGGRLFFLLDGRVVLIQATYGPDNFSWAFHAYQVQGEGHNTVGNLAGGRTRNSSSNTLFIDNLKVTSQNDYKNKGIASFMLALLFEFCDVAGITLIGGDIVKNDWAEVEKLTHIYSKFGFLVTLDNARQCGEIKWERAAD